MASGTLLAQINLQKKDECNDDLVRYIKDKQVERHSILIGIQEPHISSKKQISFLPDRNLIYHRSNDRPRAALFATNGLNIVPNSAYMDKDMATGLWITKDSRMPYIMVTSVYMDINDKELPPRLVNLVEYCRRQKMELLILTDSNSKSPFYGGLESNDRGELMELFILQHNLVVLNRGSLPEVYTYYREEGRVRTIPDVSLCTDGLEQYITDWVVTWEIRSSDHRLMEMHLNLDVLHTSFVRNYKIDNWDDFTKEVASKKFPMRAVYTVQQLEDDAVLFTDTLVTCLDKTHPKRKVALRIPDMHWWTKAVQKAHSEKRIAHNNWRNNRTEELKAIYRQKRKDYTKLQRSARRKCWQEWVSSRYDFAKVAHFNKILNQKSFNQLGLLVDDDGEPCRTPEESLNKLLSVHFPRCVDIGERDEPPVDWSRHCDINEVRVSEIFTMYRTEKAVESFGKDKAAGFDELKPVVLQHLDAAALAFLTNLFRASYLLGYIPTCWRESKVIFIPKPGKDSYCVPRSWRPISLMTFIVKAMERVLLWHMQKTNFVDRPLSANQHAFRKGRSTESALTIFVEYAERALIKHEFMLGIFLDIQGAFDNVTIRGMIEGLRAKGVDEQTIVWYEAYLLTRTITAEHKGVSISKAPVQGTPQGGVLSPIMWNVAFESFIELYPDEEDVKITVFADDGSLCVSGPDPVHLVNVMQRAVNRAIAWGNVNNLHFAPEKTIAVMFTRKQEDIYPNIYMGTYEVPYASVVRYLGAHMDDKLLWTKHVDLKCAKAKAHLYRLRRASGALWGLGPLVSCWFWRAIARPALCYGVGVWITALSTDGARRKLQKVQRIALMSMGHFRNSTPTAGLEVVTYTMPLWLHCHQEACMAFIRTKHLVRFTREEMYVANSPQLMGHRQYISEFMESIGFEDVESDGMSEVQIWDKAFSVCEYSFLDGSVNNDGYVQIYTDGSKAEDNASGAGYAVMMGSRVVTTEKYFLGYDTSVFQCEVFALKKAAEYIVQNQMELEDEEVIIYTDSQAALKALDSYKVTSKLVKDTMDVFGQVDSSVQVQLRWVKAHVGYVGNELADRLANEGTDVSNDLADLRGTDGPLIPHSGLRSKLNDALVLAWMVDWIFMQPCRQTKHFFPEINKKMSQCAVSMNRKGFSAYMHIASGHNFLGRHQSIVELGYSDRELSWCRFCDNGEESSYHIMTECDAFARLRLQVFGQLYVDPPYIIPPTTVVRFLRETRIEEFLDILRPLQFELREAVTSGSDTESD